MTIRKSFRKLAKEIAVVVTATAAFSVFVEQATGGTAQYSSDVTPLLAAVGAGDIEQVRVLLREGAKPDDPAAGRSPLIQAITLRAGHAMRCDLPIVRLLLEHGADPRRPDPRIGSLPLLTAFAVGNIECAQALLNAGAPVDSRDSGGHTILFSAVGTASRSGDMSLIDVALKWGIDKNDQSADGFTALHDAVWSQSPAVVKALLQRGVDPCVKNKIDQTPLAMAINLNRDPEMIKSLQNAKCTSGPRH
jgi:ankyrin repeat protein